MLELKNISYQVDDYDNHVEILHDISLKLDDDKFYVITGPNGGGKSTLAKIIAGIITPTSGNIYFDGQDITQMSITDRAKLGISFAFQQPVRFKGITVKDLLMLVCAPAKDSQTTADALQSKAQAENIALARACEYLSEVGLCARDYIDREINASLSGGELKRIEIAVTLARKSKLSVFDEPEAGIDLWSFSNLIQVFEKLHNETHGSIIIISHQERILNIADELICIAGGEVTQIGKKEDVLPNIFSSKSECRYLKTDR